MSGILVIWDRRGAPVADADVAAMLAAARHRARDGQHLWRAPEIVLAHQHFWVAPEERGEAQPLVHRSGQIVVTADVRLDNREALRRRLAADGDPAAVTDARLLLLAYERWGVACVEHLLGDFAFAIWDAAQRHLFVARDALGAREVCYYDDGRLFLAASEIGQLLAHAAVRPWINETKIADFLAFNWRQQDATFFESLHWCPPAHCLLVTESGARRWRYWDVDPARQIRYKREETYAAHFRELLEESVRCRVRSDRPIGVLLSGGLDSATVAALLANGNGGASGPIYSFSYVYDELREMDERRWIRPLVERYGLRATTLCGDDRWPLRDRDAWPVAGGAVSYDPFAWLNVAGMEAARDAQCTLLCGGHFGDHLFAGGTYWVWSLLRRGRWRTLQRLLRRHYREIHWRSSVVERGLRPLLPRPLRRVYRHYRPQTTAWMVAGIHPQLVQRTRLRERVLAQPGPAFASPGRRAGYRTMLWNNRPQTIATTRPDYHAYGLELVQPFADRRLVEFVLAIPADQLARPGATKWLLRRATADLLPEVVRRRPGKTAFTPLLRRGLCERARADVDDILRDAEIVRRRYVQGDWLREQVAALDAPEPATAVLSQVWLCLSLELWLRKAERRHLAGKMPALHRHRSLQ